MPQVEAVGATFAAGATTVTGLVNPSPAASALARFCVNNCGSVELISTGRYKCSPRVYWYPTLIFHDPAISRSIVKISLLRVPELEILRHRQHERQNRQRKSRRQIILVRKQGIRRKRIEPLLVRQISHARQRVQHALEILSIRSSLSVNPALRKSPAPGTNPQADELPPAEISCTDRPPSAVAESNAIASSG